MQIENQNKDNVRINKIRDFIDSHASERDYWRKKNHYYHDENERYLKFLIPKGMRVLDIGCGTGSILNSLQPSYGVGVDISTEMIKIARHRYPKLEFIVGNVEDADVLQNIKGPFDIIIISDIIGYLTDCQTAFESIHQFCIPETRLIISYFSWKWEPILRLAEILRLKMPQIELNWLTTADIVALLELADFESIKREWRILLPKYFLGIGPLINRYLGTLPIVRHFCLRNYVVARPVSNLKEQNYSATVLIPCKNERGNIENAVNRIPLFCKNLEILFVEGNSEDGTYAEVKKVIDAYPHLDIKILKQDGKGKGDAVRKGFENAAGDVLMILDADLTVPPEQLPKFYKAINSGKGEFINGSRMLYPHEKQAMRFLNYCANNVFASLFSWLLNQRFTDTLCGTKVVLKKNYQKIAANRSYFGEFDPFGDFDLIFGASKLNLKVLEIPVRYAARKYGETQISRFRHGFLLLRMVKFAFCKLKGF